MESNYSLINDALRQFHDTNIPFEAVILEHNLIQNMNFDEQQQNNLFEEHNIDYIPLDQSNDYRFKKLMIVFSLILLVLSIFQIIFGIVIFITTALWGIAFLITGFLLIFISLKNLYSIHKYCMRREYHRRNEVDQLVFINQIRRRLEERAIRQRWRMQRIRNIQLRRRSQAEYFRIQRFQREQYNQRMNNEANTDIQRMNNTMSYEEECAEGFICPITKQVHKQKKIKIHYLYIYYFAYICSQWQIQLLLKMEYIMRELLSLNG